MMTDDKKCVDFQDRARSCPLPGWLVACPKIDVSHNSVEMCRTVKVCPKIVWKCAPQ